MDRCPHKSWMVYVIGEAIDICKIKTKDSLLSSICRIWPEVFPIANSNIRFQQTIKTRSEFVYRSIFNFCYSYVRNFIFVKIKQMVIQAWNFPDILIMLLSENPSLATKDSSVFKMATTFSKCQPTGLRFHEWSFPSWQNYVFLYSFWILNGICLIRTLYEISMSDRAILFQYGRHKNFYK